MLRMSKEPYSRRVSFTQSGMLSRFSRTSRAASSKSRFEPLLATETWCRNKHHWRGVCRIGMIVRAQVDVGEWMPVDHEQSYDRTLLP